MLSAAIGNYRHTEALKSGRVASDHLRLEFADIPTINRAFAPMVREQRFDVCEMAIATESNRNRGSLLRLRWRGVEFDPRWRAWPDTKW